MDDSKIGRIKSAVKSNFNDSPDLYDAFERRYGFFGTLTRMLSAPMAIGAEAALLDVGCGSGASTRQLAALFPKARIWGLDLSPAMLAAARHNAGPTERICFVEGDAGNLTAAFAKRFDAILYTASIFLVPDFAASLEQARALLTPGGTVGASFMDAVFDQAGQNALVLAEQRLNLGLSLKRPVALETFSDTFQEMFTAAVVWHSDIPVSRQFVSEFFKVPAMSAGLFPGRPHPQRAELVERLVAGLAPGPLVFRWQFAVGRMSPA